MSAVLETMSTILDSKKIHETLEAKGFTAEQADGIYEVVSQYIPPQIHAVTDAEQRHNDDNFDRINQQFELMREDQRMMRDMLTKMDKRMDRFEDRLIKIDERFVKIDERFGQLSTEIKAINASIINAKAIVYASLISTVGLIIVTVIKLF